MELSVSGWTILWAVLSFLGVYIFMPVFMIGRDLLIIKVVERWILNAEFWRMLRVSFTDKAFYNEIYNRSTEVDEISQPPRYVIDGQEVTKVDLENYYKAKKEHWDRYQQSKMRIAITKKLITSIDKYFKAETKFEDFFEKESERFQHDASLSVIQWRELLRNDDVPNYLKTPRQF